MVPEYDSRPAETRISSSSITCKWWCAELYYDLLAVNATDSSSERSAADENVALKRALALAQLQIQDLKGQLRLALIKKYGPGSEKLSDAQLNLLQLEPGVSNVEVQAESVREPRPEPAKSQQRRKHPGRQELPAGLPRVERVIACAPEQCTCSTCGQPTAVIGYDVSEQLDVEPAKYFVVHAALTPVVTIVRNPELAPKEGMVRMHHPEALARQVLIGCS